MKTVPQLIALIDRELEQRNHTLYQEYTPPANDPNTNYYVEYIRAIEKSSRFMERLKLYLQVLVAERVAERIRHYHNLH